jgi:hypothetical protein
MPQVLARSCLKAGMSPALKPLAISRELWSACCGDIQRPTGMAIIISRSGKNAIKVDRSTIDKEDFLQRYIYENPESIPLYDIQEDIRFLILAREFPTKSGSIDALGIDQHGQIYVIETKLFRNPDKRKVVAQVLDYGAALWKHSTDFANFTSKLDAAMLETSGMQLAPKLQEFFGLSEDERVFLLENARRNLSDGAFRFVVLMDNLDSSLKDLVTYVNSNSQFDVYAVELEYYRHETQEIIIPKIFGAEVKKEVTGSAASLRKKWTEETLLADASQNLSVDEFAAFKRIYDFSKEHGELRLGTGSYASFSPIFASLSARSLFTLAADADKRLSFNFEWITRDNEHTAEIFKEKLESVGFNIPADYKKSRPSFGPEQWLPRIDKFLAILSDMLAGRATPASSAVVSPTATARSN